jgi:hypothetical protein
VSNRDGIGLEEADRQGFAMQISWARIELDGHKKEVVYGVNKGRESLKNGSLNVSDVQVRTQLAKDREKR